MSALAAGFATDMRSEGGGGADRRIVTRMNAKAGRANRTTKRIRPSRVGSEQTNTEQT